MSPLEDTYDEHSINVISTNSAGCQQADKSELVSAILVEKATLQVAYDQREGHDPVTARGMPGAPASLAALGAPTTPLTMGIVPTPEGITPSVELEQNCQANTSVVNTTLGHGSMQPPVPPVAQAACNHE